MDRASGSEDGYAGGVRALEQGRYLEAVNGLRQELRRRPFDARVSSKLGLALWHSGAREEGLNQMLRALELDSNDREVIYDSCRVFADAGRADDAREVLESYLERNPWDDEARKKLAGVSEPAVSVRGGQTFDPAAFFLAEGEAQFEKGARDRARMCFEMAFEHDPTSARACNNLGVIAWENGDLEAALNWFYQALELDGRDPEVLSNSARALAAAGQSRSALDLMELYLRRRPDDDQGWQQFREIMAGTVGGWEPKDLDPAVGEIYLRLGTELAAAGDAAGAGEALGRAALLRPGQAEPLHQLGLLHRGLGQTEEAIAMFQAALQLDDRHRDAALGLVGSLMESNRRDQAREFLESFPVAPTDQELVRIMETLSDARDRAA